MMNWVEERAIRERTIRNGYIEVWKSLVAELTTSVATFRLHFSEHANDISIGRNDERGTFDLSGTRQSRRIQIVHGAVPRIDVYEDGAQSTKKRLCFSCDGETVSIVADEKALTVSQAARLLSEDVLFSSDEG